MRIIGTLLIVAGLIGTVYFGWEAYQDSKTFTVLGADVAVSSANWTPVVVSVVVLLAGYLVRKRA